MLKEYNERKNHKILSNNYINIVDINRKMYEKNAVETIADNERILLLNEKHIA